MERSHQPPLRVRVVIPHFCGATEHRNGYGSTRGADRDRRAVAFGRCLAALRRLQEHRFDQDFVLQHQGQTGPVPLLAAAPPPRRPLTLEIVVVVTGDQWLEPVVRHFARSVQLAPLQLEDPLQLAASARDLLLQHGADVDLAMYMEDDLVLHDPCFFDKQLAFLEQVKHQAVLMPHRYELRPPQRLYVDGPLDAKALSPFPWRPKAEAMVWAWQGETLRMDCATNPHAGCFVISGPQLQELRDQRIAPGLWVGPLETAATWTVAHRWPVYKPSWSQRSWMAVEHGHPSFSHYLAAMQEG